MFVASSLCEKGYAFGEVMKARIIGHQLELLVDLVFDVGVQSEAPFNEMIFKYTFVKLVEDVKKICCNVEGVSRRAPEQDTTTKTLHFELIHFSSVHILEKYVSSFHRITRCRENRVSTIVEIHQTI